MFSLQLKGLSQISSGARTASKICYLSHVILLTVRAPVVICESPLKDYFQYKIMDPKYILIISLLIYFCRKIS